MPNNEDIVPGEVKDPLETTFDTAFPESDEFEFVRKIEKLLYETTRRGLFNILSICIAVIFALLWGIINGILQFALIWLIIPFTKLIQMFGGPVADIVGYLLNLMYGPCLKNIASQGGVVNVGSNRKENDINEIV